MDLNISEVVYQSHRTRISKATEQLSNKTFIIKTIEDLNSIQAQKTLIEEFKITQSINSDYVRKAISIESINHRPALVLADLGFSSLADKIPREGFETSVLLRVSIELAKAVQEVHQHDIIHRDINPSNILVSDDLTTLQLIDFEHAARMQERQLEFEPISQLKGTLSYMAPEQTGRINKPTDYRADLYSLGATLYRLATGSYLFADKSSTELIYSHIAVPPPEISSTRKDHPQAFSDIVSKLLEKEPSRRYQHCDSLICDLQQLASAWDKKENLSDFQPGAGELCSWEFRGGGIFGRKKQCENLLEQYEKSKLVGQFVVISGPEGIGKTALIGELFTKISANNGFYLKGKFDQFSNGNHHAAFISAFHDLINQCLDDELDWPSIFSKRLGRDAALITGLIPEYSKLLGPQKSLGLLNHVELTTRLNNALIAIFEAISQQDRQVVLFIDDLQWADSASTHLVSSLISARIPNLLLITSNRIKELADNIDAQRVLDKHKDECTTIKLRPLSTDDVKLWVEEVTRETGDLTESLAQQLHVRTQGNPFYINALLKYIHDREILTIGSDGRCRVDLEKFRKIPIGNVYEYLEREINDLAVAEKLFIGKVSILGNKFPIENIELLLDQSLDVFGQQLKILIDKGLLAKINQDVCFSHDTVQISAERSLLGDEKKALHLDFANKLRSRSLNAQVDKESSRGHKIEEYIHHFNLVSENIVDFSLRIDLAKENFIHAENLFSSGAYKTAQQSLECAVVFLPDDHKISLMSLSCDVYTKLGESLLINGHHVEGERILNQSTGLASCNEQKSKIYQSLLLHFINSNQNSLVGPTLHLLSECIGVKLPKRPSKLLDAYYFRKTLLNIKSRNPEGIPNIKKISDIHDASRDTAMSSSLLASYLAAPEYYPSLVCKYMELIFSNGITSSSAQALTGYGVLLLKYGYSKLSFRYGSVALSLSENLDSKVNVSYVNFTYGAVIHYWHSSFKSSEIFIQRGIKQAEEAGDVDTVAIATNILTGRNIYSGKNIQRILEKQKSNFNVISEIGKGSSIEYCKYNTQLLTCLSDPGSDGYTVVGEFADERILSKKWEADDFKTTRGNYSFDKAMVCCIARQYHLAIKHYEVGLAPLKNRHGSCFLPFSQFYAAISHLNIARDEKSLRHLLKAKALIRSIARLVKSTPLNYRGKHTLLKAELMGNSGQHLQAMKNYESSIKFSEETDFIQDQALSYELYGRYLLRAGLPHLALQRIADSIDCYRRWGALYKVKKLSEEFSISTEQQSNWISSGSTTNISVGSEIDFQALAESVELLSSGLETEQLLSTLMKSVMENGGATLAVYVELKQGKPTVTASHDGLVAKTFLSGNAPSTQQLDLPINLVFDQKVDKAQAVFNNIHRDKDNRYVEVSDQEDENTSTLLLPCVRNGMPSGYLYLENRYLLNAFREEKVQVLSLLANQAAIALENANAFKVLSVEKEYSSNIISSSPLMIFGVSIDGTIKFANPQVMATTSYSETTLLGSNWWKMFAPSADKTQIDSYLKRVENDDSVNIEYKITTATGEERDIVWTSFLKKNLSGDVGEIITFGSDITLQKSALTKIQNFNVDLQERVDQRTDSLNTTIENLKSTQDKLVESEKMAALGGLVAGISHEINTPIGIGVTGLSQLSGNTVEIVKKYESGSMTQSDLEQYFESCEKLSDITFKNLNRASDLIQSFKNISVDQSSEKRRKFEFIAYIKVILTSLSNQYTNTNVSVDIIDDDDFEVESHPGLFSQIFTNLILNSLTHAYDDNSVGRITISARIKGDHVLVVYRDDGKGIDSQHLKRIFDPFYTTNNHGGGTGLGLNIIYNIIVKNLSGNIKCESVPGEGAAFFITFPLESVDTLTQRDDSKATATLGHSGT